MDIAARRLADPDHWNLASAIRALAMDAVEAANSGHPGMPMGMADVATDHRTWVIAGDGCLMEGISHEAIALAGHQKLGCLIVLRDNNDITIDGRVSLSHRTDQRARFAAAGWRVLSCDGHDAADSNRALTETKQDDRRSVLVDCKTIIGFGAPNKADSSKAHGSPLGADEIAAARLAYGWSAAPFEILDETQTEWRAIGQRGAQARAGWNERVDALSSDHRDDFASRIGNDPNPRLQAVVAAFRAQTLETQPKLAARKASENVLEVLNAEMPETFGGSADLTGSNNTRTGGQGVFSPDNRKGRYLHYGIREHGMAAAMNGIRLHGGFRPYGGTFLTFTDYAGGAMRLSALMGLPVVYVMTHDSIGLGKDGPTHQPVEHLANCRATPNTLMLRPCDQIETAEAWQIALSQDSTPTVMTLSRQNLPTLRRETADNLTAKGAYILREAVGERPRVIPVATGSEIEITIAARETLEAEGIATRVVSVPSMVLFREQDRDCRAEVLPAGTVRIAIDAAIASLGIGCFWAKAGRRRHRPSSAWTALAPRAAEPYESFGVTSETVVARAKVFL